MSSDLVDARDGRDRCPGALAPFSADDGLIVRARVPGGEVSVNQLDALMAIGLEYGTPMVQITTRANLQVRGLPSPLPGEIAERMADAGLLPSRTHEKARNVLANPLSVQARAQARELDRALCQRAELADLPGRFLFLITDASGVGLTEPYDVAYVATGDGSGRMVAGGRARGCADDEAVGVMLELAADFLRLRESNRQWNLRDLPTPHALFDGWDAAQLAVGAPLQPGTTGQALIAGVPLGLLNETQLDALRSITASVTVTPWRSLVVPEGSAHHDALAEAGFVVDAANAWNRISACTGAPYCTRAETDTVELARACAEMMPADGVRLHLVGCERGCGHPRTDHVSIVGAHTVDDVATAVASSV